MSSAASRPISGSAQATTLDRRAGWRAQRDLAPKSSSRACRVCGGDRRRQRPPPRTAASDNPPWYSPIARAPGGRRPNDAVQLRASAPVCCNVWLGARRDQGGRGLDAYPASALGVCLGNDATRARPAGLAVGRAAVDSDPAPAGAGRVRQGVEAAGLAGRRAEGNVRAPRRARAPCADGKNVDGGRGRAGIARGLSLREPRVYFSRCKYR